MSIGEKTTPDVVLPQAEVWRDCPAGHRVPPRADACATCGAPMPVFERSDEELPHRAAEVPPRRVHDDQPVIIESGAHVPGDPRWGSRIERIRRQDEEAAEVLGVPLAEIAQVPRCPEGHVVVDAADVVCRSCGAELVAAQLTAAVCPQGHAIAPGWKFCPTCGAEPA